MVIQGFLSTTMRCLNTWWYLRANDLMGLLYATDEKVLFLERKCENLQMENQNLKERLAYYEQDSETETFQTALTTDPC